MTKTRDDILAEIEASIGPVLRDGIAANVYAETLLTEADWNEADPDAEINIEVPARYTVTGNPYIATFDAPHPCGQDRDNYTDEQDRESYATD